MSDGYIDEAKTATGDTLYGRLFIPAKDYEPKTKDSIYKNMNDLLDRFDTTMAWHKKDGVTPIVREGYIYEILEGDIRPVKYVVHSAKMLAKNDYTVHMSGVPKELLSSICGMTSHLKISNRMVLELNGEEQPETEQLGLCANATYDISLRVKGSMYLDSVAPIDVTGSCVNDWLLYGDTARTSSKKRYGYYYSDIEKVVKDILRQESVPSRENPNQLVEYDLGGSGEQRIPDPLSTSTDGIGTSRRLVAVRHLPDRRFRIERDDGCTCRGMSEPDSYQTEAR